MKDADDRERRAREHARAEVKRVRAEFEAARKEYDATYLRAVRAERALATAAADVRDPEAEAERVRGEASAEIKRLRDERDAARVEIEALRGRLDQTRVHREPTPPVVPAPPPPRDRAALAGTPRLMARDSPPTAAPISTRPIPASSGC